MYDYDGYEDCGHYGSGRYNRVEKFLKQENKTEADWYRFIIAQQAENSGQSKLGWAIYYMMKKYRDGGEIVDRRTLAGKKIVLDKQGESCYN